MRRLGSLCASLVRSCRKPIVDYELMVMYLAVCGVDALSNPRDLVTALLEEPFPSEEAEARNQRIRARWTDSENVLGGIIA